MLSRSIRHERNDELSTEPSLNDQTPQERQLRLTAAKLKKLEASMDIMDRFVHRFNIKPNDDVQVLQMASTTFMNDTMRIWGLQTDDECLTYENILAAANRFGVLIGMQSLRMNPTWAINFRTDMLLSTKRSLILSDKEIAHEALEWSEDVATRDELTYLRELVLSQVREQSDLVGCGDEPEKLQKVLGHLEATMEFLIQCGDEDLTCYYEHVFCLNSVVSAKLRDLLLPSVPDFVTPIEQPEITRNAEEILPTTSAGNRGIVRSPTLGVLYRPSGYSQDSDSE